MQQKEIGNYGNKKSTGTVAKLTRQKYEATCITARSYFDKMKLILFLQMALQCKPCITAIPWLPLPVNRLFKRAILILAKSKVAQ